MEVLRCWNSFRCTRDHGNLRFVTPGVKSDQATGRIKSCLSVCSSVNVVSACERMVQTSQPFLAGVTLVVHGKHLSVLGCFGIGSLSGPSTHLDQVNQSYHILNCLVDQCLSTC